MEKCKLVSGFFAAAYISPSEKEEMSEMVEDLKSRGNGLIDVMIQMAEEWPWLYECLINERDRYMVYTIRKLFFSSEDDEATDEPTDIVAVVGNLLFIYISLTFTNFKNHSILYFLSALTP